MAKDQGSRDASGPKYAGFDTQTLHAGANADPTTGARATPIYATTSFVFKDSDHAASLFNMERSGHVYSRLSNPTNAVFEERMAVLEGGVAALATASGQAALHLAVATICAAGSHIVASRALYGGSHNMLAYTMPRFGIETTFVDPRDLNAWRDAIQPNTRLLFGETLGNPGLDVLDVAQVSAIAHQAGLPLMVDSTFTTPWLLQPFAHGADLIMHSATKFIGGHGIAIGGVLVDSGAFDWVAAHDKTGHFGELVQPYAGFNGMVFAEESSVAPFALRARREGLRDFGACMSPHTAFALLQGLETLPLRMARHVENTRYVVELLRHHPMVESIAHPELPEHPDYELCKRLLPRGAGAVFSFSLKGTRAQGQRFVETLKIFSHLANVGDARSLVIHPASTTHLRVPDADLAAAGIGPGTIRLSVGLEDKDDLERDLLAALKAAERAGATRARA
jgi:O-acetylhomoserine (thiol)-lyase